MLKKASHAARYAYLTLHKRRSGARSSLSSASPTGSVDRLMWSSGAASMSSRRPDLFENSNQSQSKAKCF